MNLSDNIPPSIAFGVIALLVLLGCIIAYYFDEKGLMIYIGIIVLMIGASLIYIGINDLT